MAWRRARSPEQKERRRADLLDAAAALFDELGFEPVSLKAVAKRAGVCKANIYRYFESKEAIFLQLLQQDLRAWAADLERSLALIAAQNDVDAVAQQLAASLVARPRLAALLAVAVSVLERNLTVDAVVAAKVEMLETRLRLVNAIHAALPGLSVERTREFLSYFHYLNAGLWPAAHPSSTLEEALSRPELEGHRADYARDLRHALEALLRGMLAPEDERSGGGHTNGLARRVV